MQSREYLFTSESVTEGHPDKICDQISDAILDELLRREREMKEAGICTLEGAYARPEELRCAIETLITTGTIIISGEVRSQVYVDIEQIARKVVKEIGYDRAKYGFDAETCGVISMVHAQSPDIAAGVDASLESKEEQGGTKGCDPYDQIGAGDQGMMFGFACTETPELMPLPISLAHKLAQGLSRLRKDGTLPYLRPDGKTQVTVKYYDDKPVAIDKILISTQHDASIKDMSRIQDDLYQHLLCPLLDETELDWRNAEIYVNPTGRFVVGGPMGDTGLTGRKIIVDTYGGFGRHGGGAFSGKDCTKVDRTGAYAARWVAKNIVAAALAERCEVQIAYAIGVAHPLSVMIDTKGSEYYDRQLIEDAVAACFDLRPGALIDHLKLREISFRPTAAYGHFGREDENFTWERCDKVDELRAYVSEREKAVADNRGARP